MADRYAYLKQFHPIDLEAYRLLSQSLKSKTLSKNDFLTREGQIQRELYFVTSGIQMAYFEADTKIHVAAFTYAPDLCAIPESFFFQTPSQYFLRCLTDSTVDYLTFAELQNLFDESPAIERLFRRLTEHVLAGVIQRHLDRHRLSMIERYRTFCQRSPHLLQQVPHKYLAAYLDIDPTNFSKLFNQQKI